jgi:TrmH family RNA methyltransferase
MIVTDFPFCSSRIYVILPFMQQTSPHKPITSKDNSAIKYLRSLSDPRHRKNEQAFLIEGVKMVEEALRYESGVKMIVASPALLRHHGRAALSIAEAGSIETLWISEKLMDVVSESKTPQPILAVVRMKKYTDDDLFAHQSKLIVITHQLQDPGNLGTIIRTTEAVSAAGIALTPNTVDPYSAKAVRATMGSILRIPIVRIGAVGEFVKKCKEKGFQTVATAVTGDVTPFDIDLTKPIVVILGQEGAGLPLDSIADIDIRLRIPMAETIDSLNVATSSAVVLYEALRQRMQRRLRDAGLTPPM